MILIAATSPQQTIVGTAEALYHAHTPHSDEQFERDRRPMALTLDEFRQHLICLPLTIGEITYRRITCEEYRRVRDGG